MVENFAPGAIERLGLGADVIRALNPSIIYCQVKGFGEGSPYEKNLAFDMIAQACSGIMSTTGERDGRPLKPGPSLGDTGTGMLLSISILGALYRRKSDRAGGPSAGRDAGCHAALHAHRLFLSGPHRQGRAARGRQRRRRAAIRRWAPSRAKAAVLNDYVYVYTIARQPRTLAPLAAR